MLDARYFYFTFSIKWCAKYIVNAIYYTDMVIQMVQNSILYKLQSRNEKEGVSLRCHMETSSPPPAPLPASPSPSPTSPTLGAEGK